MTKKAKGKPEPNPVYRCGCAAVVDEVHTNANWKAYKTKCPTHGESLDWATVVS